MKAHVCRLAVIGLAACTAPRVATPIASHASPADDSGPSEVEGVARGFPAMRNLDGTTIAKGEFSQWVEGDRLQVRVRYDFGDGHSIEERSVLRQEPVLVHEHWSWLETRGGQVERKFEVDFRTGEATAAKRHGTELRTWSEHLDVHAGSAFAGGAWPVAIRWYSDRLLRGETIRLQAVGFTPKPKTAMVEITHDGLDRLPMADRSPVGDRYRIHPKLPWIARPFVDVPDSLIWLAHDPPHAFLRWEGALMEPDDAIVRVDLLPGGTSSPAAAVQP